MEPTLSVVVRPDPDGHHMHPGVPGRRLRHLTPLSGRPGRVQPAPALGARPSEVAA